MIEFVPRSGPPEAAHCPAVVCDTCRQQVAGSGNIVWAYKMVSGTDEPRQQSPLYAAHKGRCDRALDAWLKKHYPEGQWLLMWEELDAFLRYLNKNAVSPFSEDEEGEYHQVIVRQPRNDPHDEIPTIS